MRFDKFLPSPFYRVAVKVLVFDDKDRLLLVRSDEGWEVPGGGWEHDEDFATCITREVDEELGVRVRSHSDVLFTYRGKNVKNYIALRLVVRVQLQDGKLEPKDDEILETGYFSKDELVDLPMSSDEEPIKDHATQIWNAK